MTTEAALLGIPSVSFYPAPPTYVERYLTRLRLITRIGDLERIVKYVIRILGDEVQKEALKAASRRIRSKMEDPMAVIEKHLR
jgi:predicted glycosyltransferase